jgi:metal-responsive CopG/Arc/MetJ family transcriptional regulator
MLRASRRLDRRVILIHTPGMKVAVSIPDAVFEEAEKASKHLRVSRSHLYSQALAEFVKKHRGQGVREALDAVYSRKPSDLDPLLMDLQARALREDW